MEPARCSVRLCRCESAGESPVTCQPLCTSHMQDDLAELEVSEARVADRIQHFKKYQTPVRMMQQRLASDLQMLDDTFADLRETLDRCQSELISVITKQHDQLMDSLTSVSELEDFEKDLKRAKDENNMRQAFIINRSMEKSLKTLQLDSRLVRMNEESQEIEIAAYPDLNSRVMELQVALGSELVLLKKVVEQFSFADCGELDEVELHATKKVQTNKLSATALCLTVCNNTEGFGLDASGSIAKAAEDSGVTQLPQPSIFVAVQVAEMKDDSESSDVQSENSSSTSEFILLLLSTDAEVVGRPSCSWEADQPIRDLHCDNERQLLFIAQKQAVTVADLSGVLKSRISVSDLQEDARKLYCIAGNKDKLFALIKEQSDGLAVVGISKDSGQVQMTLPVPDDCILMAKTTQMAVKNRMLFLSDRSDVFTICTITEKLVSSRSLSEEVFGIDFLPMEIYGDALAIVQANLSYIRNQANGQHKSTSAEFQLVPCASPLLSVPTSNASQYILSTDGDTEYKLVKLDDENVVIETWKIDYVVKKLVEESEDSDSYGSIR